MDPEILRQVLAGDISKYTYFINKYGDMAFTIAYRILSNKEDAQEVVQDSFLRAYKSLSKFRNDSKFSTWFYRIVVNCALSRRKQNDLEPAVVDLSQVTDGYILEVETTYKGLSFNNQKEIIDEAMEELHIEDRILLTLYYLNENSLDEINEITGISQENIKMKLHRARKKMYIILKKYFWKEF